MSITVPQFLKAFVCTSLLFCCTLTQAQQRGNLRGIVINDFTKESVPFATIYWKRAGAGTTTDSAGQFTLRLSHHPIDTLVVSYVGFADVYKRVLNTYKDTAHMVLVMRELKMANTVEVKSKFNKGLRWWKAIVANKTRNNPYKYENYAYELYNKMELDINNVSRKYFTDKKLLKPFLFLLDNIDSVSDQKPFLPVYMTEALSDYYYSVSPHRVREEIKAAKTDGMKNESMLQFIGGMNQKINVYENYTNALGKEFISPLSDVGDKYYNYKGADTQYIGGQRYLHLLFTPKREGENTFSGDCWIHGGNWGIYKINLNISSTANINYVNRLSIVQEFALRADSAWMFAKDKAVIDFTPFGKEKLSFIARRTSTYRNVRVNDSTIERKLAANNQKEEVVVAENAREKDGNFWEEQRHEELSTNEKKVYRMMDTIKTVPAFIKYTKAITFIFDGHKKLGAVEIGPWYKWISGNQLEKIRLRFDLGTTEQFSKYLRLHGYLAYGFKDGRWKGRGDVSFKFPGDHGITLFGSYTHDLDNGRTRYNDEDITTDNIFSQLIRRQGIRQKFLGVEEAKFAVTKEWKNKFSVQPFFTRTAYETFNPLPTTRSLLNHVSQKNIVNSEMGLRLRYAPGERTFARHRKEIRLKSNMPVFEARAAWGIEGLLGSNYQYSRIGANITHNTRIPRWGKLNYMVYGGQIFSNEALPFMVLEIHPGNEIYYYNKQSFNLMNRFEYISDKFVGINLEHNLEKKLINLLPFMRKTNMRQFWNVKSVWGNLSDKNRLLNIQDYYYEYRMRALRGGFYTEVGTGFENIFKLLRIDLVWRFAPLRNIPPGMNPALFKSRTNDFGIFGSVRFQF
ncbi:MAG: carboxypeptidase-like regulatory domain-containing protein [Chitinophagaceae bacterium]|nr:carboxypeptidase-like regulatory domain-containing protein [Chitinophagaceae bacterium]MCA6457197.1 carboxypeptidase-like regulatory domain-containing protein [Chitinophagaceae bacterium]MCA6457908.1 carboxypeptidase-like regulatory domain-containing protein [Chitinophagaceae bacterium]MCA6463621.1 carboxypeptidase-like regulatory domain-containing protein [Chitinophagaceae bacterium]